MEEPQTAVSPLLGRITVAQNIQLIVDAGLLAASIILYPPQVKHWGWQKAVRGCQSMCAVCSVDVGHYFQ